MATVELRPNESQEQLLKRFRKKVQRERVLSDVRKKRVFLSNSEKRRTLSARRNGENATANAGGSDVGAGFSRAWGRP